MLNHYSMLYGPPSEAVKRIPRKQVELIKQICKGDCDGGGTLSIHKITSCSLATVRKMRDGGVLYMHTGGTHGGSHRGWVELTGYGKSLAAFLSA